MPLLKTELISKTLHICLCDPESRNAFSPQMATEFQQAMDQKGYSSLLVSSEGPSFCAGGNLKFYSALKKKEEGLLYNLEISQTLERLHSLPVPTMAIVDGGCFGGGVEFLSCFDYVSASPASLFGLWQRRIGLTFGWGGQERLNQRIGKQRTMKWLSQANTLSAFQARDWGLIDEVSLAASAFERALTRLNQTVGWGQESFRTIKSHGQKQGLAFKELWFNDHHRNILEKFK